MHECERQTAAALTCARWRVAHEARRWCAYQRERFPLCAHGLLIAVFSASTASYSALLRGQTHLPGARTLLVAFGCSLLFFLQLRIADEFKDREEDARFRPYRPVPRGLVSLRELGLLALIGAGVQGLLTLWLSPSLMPFLILAWVYLAAMSKEFFVREWLKARPITYLWSHMLIVPLIDLYGTACDWRVAGAAAPAGLLWLLLVSLCNGFVLEIGRKVRAPEEEEAGVATYSVLWGRGRAVAAWLSALAVTAAGAWLAAWQVHVARQEAMVLAVLLLTAALIGARFLRAPQANRARWIERMSGAWTLLLYPSLGLVPLLTLTRL